MNLQNQIMEPITNQIMELITNQKGGHSCPKCKSWISEGEDHCDTCGWPFS